MSCRNTFVLAVFVTALVLCSHSPAISDETDEPRSYGEGAGNTGNVAASAIYKDTMLIAVGADGVAAIVFGDPIEHGRNYRFRFQPKDGSAEITGQGVIFERRTNGQYDGGKLTIRAGMIKLGWSFGGLEQGWFYYEPEKLRLQIASAKRFEDTVDIQNARVEKLDLKRFLEK